MDFNGIMADASGLMDMANNPMGAINSIAGDTISDVTKSLGVDNIKSIGDVSNLTNTIMNNNNIGSDSLNSMVSDVSNALALGDGDG